MKIDKVDNPSISVVGEGQDVDIYVGMVRGAIGSSKAMLYLMKDAMLISIGEPSLMNSPKTEQLSIQQSATHRTAPGVAVRMTRASNLDMLCKAFFPGMEHELVHELDD